MEGETRTHRNVPTTKFLLALAVGYFGFFFFVSFWVPIVLAVIVLVVVCGVIYVLDLLGLSKFLLPNHRRKELTPIIGMPAAAGWFTSIGAGRLHHDSRALGLLLAVAGMCSALGAARGVSGLLKSNKAGLAGSVNIRNGNE